jgi:ribose transport system permease protein
MAAFDFRKFRASQEQIVLLIAVLVFAAFAVKVPGFLSASNITALIQNVSVLGILATGMALSVLGRNIDLSMVASMSISVAWMLVQLNAGAPFSQALFLAVCFSCAVGLINGFLVAYVEVPAIFVTLATAVAIYGFGKYFLVESDVNYLPENLKWLAAMATAHPLGIPVPVIIFALVSLAGYLFLRHIREGRFIYAMGDNPLAARTTGIPVRALIVLQYVLSALIALAAGLLMTMLVVSMNTRIVASTLVYDVILVVVLGGVSLSGGRGGIKSVAVGTILIGILLNGMTMLNLTYTVQNVIKALILLAALTLDSLLNPRDEQTAQQGDI